MSTAIRWLIYPESTIFRASDCTKSIIDGRCPSPEELRYLHTSISGVEAEQLLLEKGVPGSFLVRPSHTHAGNFTLSVRCDNEVTHIRIQNKGDYFDLYGGDSFATLSELIDNYTIKNSSHLKKMNGDIVKLVYPLNSTSLFSEIWFHSRISGDRAAELVMAKDTGSFLIRESISQPGDYVLAVNCENSPTQIRIASLDGGKFDAGGGAEFATMAALIEEYRNKPLIEYTGKVILLNKSINVTSFQARSIQSRIKELTIESRTLPKCKAGFSDEFDALQTSEIKQTFTRKEGSNPVNRGKNRFKNILPFDYSRVKLRNDNSVDGMDYINANWILPFNDDKSLCLKKYIATQGCTLKSVNDLWRMIMQENIQIVIMVCQTIENEKQKCCQYWPDERDIDEEKTYGEITVRRVSETATPFYIVRELRYSTAGVPDARAVFQFHFQCWTDFRAPENASCILDFLRDINVKYEQLGSDFPITIHCSAGIGRSGTLLAIDVLLDVITAKGLDQEIDIQQTVLDMRNQRSGMVQTQQQYEFIYAAICDYVQTMVRRQDEEKKMKDAGKEYENVNHGGIEDLEAPYQNISMITSKLVCGLVFY